jgi:hypothetical protein
MEIPQRQPVVGIRREAKEFPDDDPIPEEWDEYGDDRNWDWKFDKERDEHGLPADQG